MELIAVLIGLVVIWLFFRSARGGRSQHFDKTPDGWALRESGPGQTPQSLPERQPPIYDPSPEQLRALFEPFETEMKALKRRRSALARSVKSSPTREKLQAAEDLKKDAEGLFKRFEREVFDRVVASDAIQRRVDRLQERIEVVEDECDELWRDLEADLAVAEDEADR